MGDEPELILEAYSQVVLSTANSIQILRSQVTSTEELVKMKLDTIRNKLLAYNTILSLMGMMLAACSLVGSFFGMNLVNHLENDGSAFGRVVGITVACAIVVSMVFVRMFNVSGVFAV